MLRLKIRVGENTIGPGKMALLALLAETGSISESARRMGISYRRTWFLLNTLQSCFEAPLYSSTRGRAPGAGTQLTDEGRALLAAYEAFRTEIDATAAPFLDWIEKARNMPVRPTNARGNS